MIQIIGNLREVYDREIHINVYDLGLIYEITRKENNPYIDIVMTLTSAFCPMADEIIADVHSAVCMADGVETCDVEITFDPSLVQIK